MITKTDRKLLFILCITVVVLVLAKCMTSEGYTLKPEIKFNWRNTTTDDITKWTIKLTGNVGNGVTTLETKVIKKEDNPEYFKPFQSNEVTFQPQEFTLNSIKSGLKVEVYYNDGETLYTRKTVYLKKNMFSIALDLLTKIQETLFVYTPKIKASSDYVTIKSQTGTKKFIINEYDEFEYVDTSKVFKIQNKNRENPDPNLKDSDIVDQTFEEKYRDKPCLDIFYVHNIDDGSGEFYLRSANNSKWARKFRRYYRSDNNAVMQVHKLNVGTRNDGSDKSRFFYQEYDKANEVTNRNDQFHIINTKDGSWRDNARKYKVNTDDGCLYRIEDANTNQIHEAQELLGMEENDKDYSITQVYNYAVDKLENASTEAYKTKINKAKDLLISRTTEEKISDDAIVFGVAYNTCDVTEIGKDTGIENKYDSPNPYSEDGSGYDKKDNNDWSGGCRHLGEYDRKGKTEGCEGKFSTADLYSSPPFRHLLKEFHTYTRSGPNLQTHEKYKKQRNGRYTSQKLNDKVCPVQTTNDKGENNSIMKELKTLIDAQCEAIENKGFCVKEKPNSATSAKIKTIQDGFNESKMKALRSTDSDSKYVREALHHQGRAIGDDFNPDTHLPDFDINFSSICNWRGGQSKTVLEEEKCHAKPRKKLIGSIRDPGYPGYSSKRATFNTGYEQIQKKCSETALNKCSSPKNNDFGSGFYDLYKNTRPTYHVRFSVCEKAKYGWDDNGIYYNVADRN